jgi:hypothetical protein
MQDTIAVLQKLEIDDQELGGQPSDVFRRSFDLTGSTIESKIGASIYSLMASIMVAT